MSRRTHQISSSLDLFLDTICNTFGGIVFVAILLSVLVQMRSKKSNATPTPSPSVSSDQYREVTLKLDELLDKRQRLSETVSELKSLQGNVESDEVRQLQQQQSKMQVELDSVIFQQAEQAKSLAGQLQENKQIVDDLEALRQQLTDSQAALEQEQLALDEALADRMEVLKLPQVKISSKASVLLLCHYGKVYPVYEPLSDQPFARHITAANSATGLSVSPIPDAGWSLADSAQRELLQEYIAAHHAHSYFASIAIWPDSFAEFASLKEMMLELDFEYQLKLFSTDEAVVITQGRELPQVQ